MLSDRGSKALLGQNDPGLFPEFLFHESGQHRNVFRRHVLGIFILDRLRVIPEGCRCQGSRIRMVCQIPADLFVQCLHFFIEMHYEFPGTVDAGASHPVVIQTDVCPCILIMADCRIIHGAECLCIIFYIILI